MNEDEFSLLLSEKPNYMVLQIKVDAPIDGIKEFWYEGNNIVINDKKVYVGYNEEAFF